MYKRIQELKRGRLIRKQLNLLVQLIELKIYKYDNWQSVISSNRLTCCSRLTDCLNALWNGICIRRDWCEVGSWKRAVIWFLVSWIRFVLLSRFFLIKPTNCRKKTHGKFYGLLNDLWISYCRLKWIVSVIKQRWINYRVHKMS